MRTGVCTTKTRGGMCYCVSDVSDAVSVMSVLLCQCCQCCCVSVVSAAAVSVVLVLLLCHWCQCCCCVSYCMSVLLCQWCQCSAAALRLFYATPFSRRRTQGTPSPTWNALSEHLGEADVHLLIFSDYPSECWIAFWYPLAVIGPLTTSYPKDIISRILHFLFHSLSVPILL